MTELSPAAIAVDDALAACIQLQGEIVRARPLAAAALRAAADHVDHDWSGFNCVDALCEIAAELEAND
ncbi:hypothetical protein S-CBS2_gp066 [Synechococcus phage S-CBS2]|uniref:hypothetical protein n=1 Tax=Synechococcus phage S-CBS2 TaxID=753084 RepID=UPI000207841B|nr:hypothetical protein S-CBS2_gp066 [Synechococcus phage S-CBS2]ADF42422.1 hypothetical protein S-CBS2_gp066 [Synechococcus phage S-CBS2]